MKRLIKHLAHQFGYEISRRQLRDIIESHRRRHGEHGEKPPISDIGDDRVVCKAPSSDFDGRFREILSDPLNLLIRRHPEAGRRTGGLVTLHNGHRVPVEGESAYYGDFARILIYNRGVHEPLEEFAFQCLLPHLPVAPIMLELGAYWAHYSMWMAQVRPDATLHLIEPDPVNLKAGKANFALNGYHGNFRQGFIGQRALAIDPLLDELGLERLTLLHSDIQGHEVDMLKGAAGALAEQRIDWLFISTHSQGLHVEVVTQLCNAGYRIEVHSDYDYHTTSSDGFVMAAAPHCPPVLSDRRVPLGRTEILTASPLDVLSRLTLLAAT